MFTRDMHVHFPSFYTLSRSFLTPLNLHIQVYGYSFCRSGIWGGLSVLWEAWSFLLAWSSSLGIFFLLILIDFVILCILDSVFIPFIYSCVICWTFICIVAMIVNYYSDYITCSGYIRLSVYSWGILLAYICRWLYRVSAPEYFGKRCVTVFLVSEPGLHQITGNRSYQQFNQVFNTKRT